MLSERHASIMDLAPRLASGELTAEALLADCHEAIAEHAALGAMLTLNQRALGEARQCDADWRKGTLRGPLHGVPIVVKDNIDVHGLPTTSGNRAMARAMPLGDAVQVDRLRRAGAIILGKTNLSEFSFEIRSRSSLGGDVRNPFLHHVTAGGSSGGTAVAVAVGLAPAGLGSDTGGSIRVPASYTGLVGLRPTYAALDIGGVAPLAPSTDTIGPIGRSIADVAMLFGVMGGRTATAPQRGLRVGVMRQAFGVAADIATAMARACDALAAAGVAIVDPVHLPQELLPIERPHIVDAEFADAFDAYLASHFAAGSAPASLAAIVNSEDYLYDYRDVLRQRMAGRGAGRAEILTYHRTLRDALSALMADHALDAILYPTSMVTPSSLDNPNGGWGPELAACAGWPALSVPTGRSMSGVPIGAELLGRAGAEPLLFTLGGMIEREVGPRVIPPLS